MTGAVLISGAYLILGPLLAIAGLPDKGATHLDPGTHLPDPTTH